MKYKVGDRVRVVSDKAYPRSAAIGKVGTISHVRNSACVYPYRVDGLPDVGHDHIYDEDELQPAPHAVNVGSVVVDIVPRVVGERRPRVYVSGPMSGLPEQNFPAFNAAAEKLSSMGYDVVNPAEKGRMHHEDGTEWSWREYLAYDLKQVVDCDAIYMLDGWQRSKGAGLERDVALQLGLLDIRGAV